MENDTKSKSLGEGVIAYDDGWFIKLVADERVTIFLDRGVLASLNAFAAEVWPDEEGDHGSE